VILLRLGADDLARCRFAVSPLLETTGAVRALAAPGHHAPHLPWLRQAPQPPDPVLRTLIRAHGYTPDFLTPPPDHPLITVEEELAAVAATPAELAVQEVQRSLAGRSAPPEVRDLLTEPDSLADRVAERLAVAWRRLVRPHWERLRSLLDSDITYRGRGLARRGLAALLTELHPQVHWDGSRVRIAKAVNLRRDLRGEGLLLVPSAFGWPQVRVVLDPPWQPTLIYPARGVGAVWERPAEPGGALGRLLGNTRSRLLIDLGEPASTRELAHRHRLAAATVSHHLKVMQQAGLLAAERDGRSVRYVRTPLGHHLAR
jgi:DNA-binding transcriptional ArsR family regulator